MKKVSMKSYEKINILFFLSALATLLLFGGCATESQSKQALNPPNITPPAEQNIAGLMTVPKSTIRQAHLGAPLTNISEKQFLGSGRCTLCHDKLTDKNGNDMSIPGHWRSTMMANGAKDPLWQAKVASETHRNPAIKAVIEQKCVTCHMPMAWVQIQNDSQYGDDLSRTPFSSLTHSRSPLADLAMDGISCSFCHQVQDKDLGIKKSFSGKFTIDSSLTAPDRPIYGPYKETVPEPMQTSIGFTPTYGAHTNDSALCATCHTLYTPYLDGQGNIAGEFPEQTPYLEWLHSEYGEPTGTRHDISETKEKTRICQECHMPHSEAGGVLIARPSPKQAKEKDHFSQHHFVGGNVLMLNILEENTNSLDVSASSKHFEDTKKRTTTQLQRDTATLSLIEKSINNNTLTATLQIYSMVGHKFPTGFPSRRTWLHVAVQNSVGEIFFESGAPMENGAIVEDDSNNEGQFEPHYDLITNQNQVQIYETIMHNTDGKVTNTLLRAASYIKDNRLLPNGFDKKTASKDIAVYGNAITDSNFSGGIDKITYAISVNNQPGPFTITARLLYSPLSYAFMQDLNQDSSLAKVNRFASYYDKTDKTPVAVAALQELVK